MNFNEKLISLCKSKGLSQEELGAQLKVSRQTISKWESGAVLPRLSAAGDGVIIRIEFQGMRKAPVLRV